MLMFYFFNTRILHLLSHDLYLLSHDQNLTITVMSPTLRVQSTLIISKSKGLSQIIQDIRTSTYQICRIGEKINRITFYNEYVI